jgi:hypothetical protein
MLLKFTMRRPVGGRMLPMSAVGVLLVAFLT